MKPAALQEHLFLLLHRVRQLQRSFAVAFFKGAATGFGDVIFIGVDDAIGVGADVVGGSFVGVTWHPNGEALDFTAGRLLL